MAQENSISISFSAAEQKSITDPLAQISTALAGKTASLTPQQRQTFGRVKYEKEVFIDKTRQHMDANPTLIPGWIDKAEYDRDYEAHKLLNGIIASVEQIYHQLLDTNILLGYDLDSAANTFYQNAKMAAKANAPGARTVYEDLRQQYPGTSVRKTNPENK